MDYNKVNFHKKVTPLEEGSDKDCSSVYGIPYRITAGFGYYVGIIPFKLGEDGTVYRNRVQRIFCGISYICMIYIYFTELRKLMVTKTTKSVHIPAWYFQFFTKVGTITVKTYWSLLLWRIPNQDKFGRVISGLRNLLRSQQLPIHRKKLLWTGGIALCTFYYVLGLLTWIFGSRISPTPIYQNTTSFYMNYTQEAKFAFFFTSSTSHTTGSLKGIPKMIATDHLLTATFMIFQFFRCVIGVFFDTLYIATTVTLFLPTLDFVRTVETQVKVSSRKLTLDEVTSTLTGYKWLKDFAEELNHLTDWGILTFMLEMVTFYSTNINAIFVAPDWFERVRMGVLSAGGVAVLITSAEICRRMEIMKDWIRVPAVSKSIADGRAPILLSEFSDTPVAISGGLFKITYSFLGQVLTTMITFFIICLAD